MIERFSALEHFFAGRRGSALIAVLLFVLALGVRLPYLMDVPGFTDEGVDVLVGLDALDGRWPLVDAEPYIGSLFNYLLAAGFLALGRDSAVPRLVVTVLGALTVVLVYFLARRLAGRAAGLLTAGFMATSGVHAVNGHIAWSNCTTPFFAAAATLALVEAVARGHGPLLVLAGGLYGLALQSHNSAIFLGPALVIHALAGRPASSTGRRTLLLSRWPPIAALAALLASANLIAFNLLNPGVWERETTGRAYAYVAHPTVETYLQNLEGLGAGLFRMAASSFVGGPSLLAQATSPGNLPYLVLILLGAAYAVKRRHWLPLAAIVATALLMPYINRYYRFPIGLRYLGYLLPFVHLLMALTLVQAGRALSRRSAIGRPLAVAVCLVLVALPADRLFGYYDAYLRLGATNPTILALSDEIRERHQAGLIAEVLLDPQLDAVFTAPGGRALRVFETLLTVEGVPHRTVWMAPEELERTAPVDGPARPVALIMSAGSRERLGGSFRLPPLEVVERPYLHRDGYWAYTMLGRSEDAPDASLEAARR
jgi:4-amino-4-deoxy-L-arabinose transferase-like glycosyltransferase